MPIFQQLDEPAIVSKVVITAPSRELATQICPQSSIAAHSDVEVRVVNYVGGAG